MSNKQKDSKQKYVSLLEESEAILKVVYWFFAFPTKEISLNDLSRNVGLSKTNANAIVTQLVDEGFLNREILGKVWRISCNQSHPYNTILKIPFNLQLIYQSRIIETIHQRYPNARSIVLFGSYRKGDDTENSDIDIGVEVLDNESVEIENLGVIDQLGFRTNVNVNLHVWSRSNVDLNLFANIANGIVLSGFLEVRP